MNARVAALENKIGTDDSALANIRNRLTTLEVEKNAYSTVYLDPSAKGFERLDTNSGTFLIALKDVKPYANGYKLILSVGNASAARYDGFTIHIKWGKSWDSLSNSDPKFTQSLYPGTWNTVAVVLSPAKSDDLADMEMTMDTEAIYMFVR